MFIIIAILKIIGLTLWVFILYTVITLICDSYVHQASIKEVFRNDRNCTNGLCKQNKNNRTCMNFSVLPCKCEFRNKDVEYDGEE